MSRVDVGRIRRLVDEIVEGLNVIKDVISMPKNSFLNDLRSRYAIRYAVVEIVEAAALIGLHILENVFGVSPETYSEIFDALAKFNIIDLSTRDGMRKLVGLRNIVVHRYWMVDDSRIYDEAVGGGLMVIERFIGEVEDYVGGL